MSAATSRSTLRQTLRSAPVAAVILTAVSAGMAGCSGGSAQAPATPTASSGSATPTTNPTSSSTDSGAAASGSKTSGAVTTKTVTVTSPGTGSGAACKTNELGITVGPVDAGAGQRVVPVIFHNIGHSTCTLHGYPSVAALNAAGEPVTQAKHQPANQIPVVTLAAGAKASATVHAVAVPTGSSTCAPDYKALQITPPGQTSSVKRSVTLPACGGLTVSVVKAGA